MNLGFRVLISSRSRALRGTFFAIIIASLETASMLNPSRAHADPILLSDWYSPGGLDGSNETWDMNLVRETIDNWNHPVISAPPSPLPFLPYPTEHDGRVRDSNVGQITVTIQRDPDDVYLLLQSGLYDRLIYLIGHDTGDSVTISIPTLFLGGPPQGLVYYALFDAPALGPFPHLADSGNTLVLLTLGSFALLTIRWLRPRITPATSSRRGTA